MQANSTPEYVVVRYQGTPGLLAAAFGCLFGILGIFSWGLVFVPLAAVCSIVAIIQLLFDFHFAAFGTTLVALFLTGAGALTSPSVMVLIGSIVASLTLTNYAPQKAITPPIQRRASSMNVPAQRMTLSSNPRDEALAASLDCKSKRLSGELKSHVASVECSNPRILIAYENGGYRYMDLIQLFIAKRRALAEQVDKGIITEAQDETQLAQFMGWVADEERRRNGGQR